MRTLASALIFISSIYMVFSQEQTIPSLNAVQPLSEQMDSLLSAINNREKELELIKKDRAKADSLEILVKDYVFLVKMWQDGYKQKKKTSDIYNSLECLLSGSDSVFNAELPDSSVVPASLKNHYNLITQVVSIKNDIAHVEQEIEEKTNACIALNQDPMDIVPPLISPDLDNIYNKIAEIKETGLPTFSDIQKKYFDDNIKEKYNGFKKYFTNE